MEDAAAPATLKAYFQRNRQPDQCFIIDPTCENIITGRQGTQFTIPPLSFQDRLGWSVRRPLKLYLNEVYTPAQIIMTGLGNTSEDRLLETAGQFYLGASADGEPLRVALPVSVTLPISGSFISPLSARLFCGGISQTASIQTVERFDWQLTPLPLAALQLLDRNKFLQFSIDRLNWWNCSAFVWPPDTGTMVSVRWTAPSGDSAEVAAFLVFKERPTVVRMYRGRHGFSSWNVPKGWTARVIAIGWDSGRMLLGCSPWAHTSNRPIRIRLESFAPEAAGRLLPGLCTA